MLRRASHSKKGALPVYEAVMWIARGLILAYILLSVKFVTGAFIVKNLDTRMADSYVLMSAIYYSESVSFKDAETGRVYPGIMDVRKPAEIASFTFGDGTFIASKIGLAAPGLAKDFFYDKATFEDWNFLYIAGLTEGIGGVKKFGLFKKVIAAEDGKEIGADATLEVVTKNA